jgi:regulatory protein
MMQRKQLSKEEALQKLRHYCAYQDRSHFEAREKLYSYGLRKQEVEESLSQLIEENFLNEERFAIQFAGGKFRMKQWGRTKIKYELKQKRVSEYCIKTALSSIDEETYQKTLLQLAKKKWTSIKGDGVNLFVKMSKTKNFLLQRGFEPLLVSSVVKNLSKERGCLKSGSFFLFHQWVLKSL